MNNNIAISVKNLTKIYNAGSNNEILALDNISLDITAGSIFGLLGPNGAGKSTFINILADLVRKSEGDIKILGTDHTTNLKKVKSLMGIVPQELNIDPFFTPFELLEIHAGLYGVPKKERQTMDILGMLALEDKAHVYARTLSGGMRRRLLIAKAMVHDPAILILDEPTAALGVAQTREVLDVIKQLRNTGHAVVYISHNLRDVFEVCDRITVLRHGQNVAIFEATKSSPEEIVSAMTLGGNDA